MERLLLAIRCQRVSAEEYPLRLLFQNIVGNAIKYHRPEQPPCVHVSAQRDGSNWTFSVADNGIGIKSENAEKIFAAFKRLHGGTYPGTGLGLAMCKKIVERYYGRIWVESDGRDGSKFRFTLPVADGQT